MESGRASDELYFKKTLQIADNVFWEIYLVKSRGKLNLNARGRIY